MSLFIKICGMTTAEAVLACTRLGVDALGFVFSDSPRRVSPTRAAQLAAEIPDSIAKVAVFRRPTIEEMEGVLDVFPADLVQADHDTLPRDDRWSVLPVYRQGSETRPGPGMFLYEGPSSGVGETVDWVQAAELATHGEMVLAGGLDARNVRRAISVVGPFGVDVSSGVEARPGLKDPELIANFVSAARGAARKMVQAT